MMAEHGPATTDAVGLLGDLAVLNRDDGERFTDARRLEAIARALCETSYSCVNSRGLFSLCVPVEGDMHSGDGILMRKGGFMKYVEALRCALAMLAADTKSS